jgi:Tfp pilus assembly protein PilF
VEAQIQLQPKNAFFQNLLGRVQEMNQDLGKAEAAYKKALELDPNVNGFHLSLAGFYARHNLVDKAVQQFQTALQQNPNALAAHMGLGIIYQNQNNLEKAKEAYQKALKVNPKFAPAANNLAYLYAEKGENVDEALNLAQMAKEQFPEDPSISDTLGWVYYKKNIPTRAIVYFKEALEKVKDNAVIHYHLGLAYFKNNQKDLARQELKKALEIDPKFAGAEEARATLQKIK